MTTNKIKTFHIIGSSKLGGAENFFVRMVEALTRAGHPTVAITRSGGPVAALFSPAVEQVQLPLASKWDYWSRWQLTRLIEKHQPAIVQSYMSRASRLTRLPAGSAAVHIARLGGYYTIPGNFNHADAWVGVTRDICDYLAAEGIDRDQVFHIGNFVPRPSGTSQDELQRLRASLQLPSNAKVIFALGRMIEKKGFQDLLAAFSLLPESHQDRPLMLVLAGDGSERARYEALAKQLGVDRRVRFAGWQTNPLPYFKLADLFVCPSRHEPLGNILLEAWTSGVPVLTTRTHGAQELADPDRNALMVPIADPAAMADGLQRMLALSPAQLKSLVDEGYKATGNHSEEAVVQAYVALYERLGKAKATAWEDGANNDSHRFGF